MQDDLKNPGVESLIFKPSKVSWAVNSYLGSQDNLALRRFVYAVLGLVAVFLLWCAGSEKAIVVDSFGEIITVAPPVPVTSSTAMTIREIKVKNNQSVAKGDVIAISTRETAEEDNRQVMSAFNTLQVNLNADRDGVCKAACQDSLRSFADRGFPWLNGIDSGSELHHDLGDLGRVLKDYAVQNSLVASLPETTSSIRHEMDSFEEKLKKIKRLKAQKVMGVEYDELNTRYENLKSQLREKTLNANASLKSARNAVEVVLQKIPQDLKNYVANSTIRAPADGVVSFVDLKGPGQNISPGQTLVYLQGAGSELGVRLKVSDSDIGKVRRGMDVKLDIASYPSSEYGVQSATIREIPQKLDTSGKQSDSTFDVYGDLAAQHVLFKGQKYPLRSGVSLRAKIIVSHETLLKYYLKQLLSLKDEYLGDS